MKEVDSPLYTVGQEVYYSPHLLPENGHQVNRCVVCKVMPRAKSTWYILTETVTGVNYLAPEWAIWA